MAAAGLAISAATIVAAPYFLHRETVRFEVDGAEVHGLDKNDRPTWSYALPAPPARVIEADLDGDGHPEFVAAGRPAEESSARLQTATESYVVALTDRGVVMTSLVPEEAIRIVDLSLSGRNPPEAVRPRRRRRRAAGDSPRVPSCPLLPGGGHVVLAPMGSVAEDTGPSRPLGDRERRYWRWIPRSTVLRFEQCSGAESGLR